MSKNTLFPIFLKTDQAHFLIVGGGNIGLEKTETLLKQNPEVKITIVSPDFLEEVKNISAQNSNVTLKQKLFDETDLESVDFVIAATNIKEINAEIKTLANARKILVNAADQPDLCDFYLGSIVNKGNLKIAISTNGKSPTIAKRLKETLTEALPEQLDDLIVNLNKLRNHLSGDFKTKVNILNKVTENLSTHPEDFDKYISDVSQLEKSILVVKRARRIVNNTLLTMGGLLVLVSGFFMIKYFNLWPDILLLLNKDNNRFFWMMFTGFVAEIVAGSVGMGYGVICTTILLSFGIAPHIVTASIHSAESFTSMAGSISHYKLKNVNKNMVKKLVIPAIVGVIIGVAAISFLGEGYAKYVKPFISIYTLYLGFKIFQNSVLKKTNVKYPKKKANFKTLGVFGGFIDSFTGGGWGPLVTGTLIKNGYTPRYVVGSSTVAKFILTVASAIAFIYTIGIHHWNIVLGLLIGGIVTAPFSARLTSKIPSKYMFIAVGVLVMTLSIFSIVKTILSF